MPQPHLRAADTDRAAVAEILGRHMSAGRLTLEEFDERLTRAYAAKTFGELDELTADLPALDAGRSPAREGHQAANPAPVPMTGCGAGSSVHGPSTQSLSVHGPSGHGSWGDGDDLRSAWRGWLITASIVLTVWAATSLASWEFHYFWPVWVIGPWGAVLLARTVTGSRGERPEEDRQRSS